MREVAVVSQQPSATELPGLDEYQRLLALLDERRFDESLVRGRLLLESVSAGPLVRAKTHNLICWTFIEGLKRASPEAVLNGEEAVALATALAERSLMLQAQFNLASAYYQMGDYASARAIYQQMLVLLAADPSLIPYGQVIARQGLAQLDLVEGQPEVALAHLDAALELCREGDAGFLQAELHRRRTLALLKLDRVPEAAEALSRVDENACASGPRSLWWKTHLGFTRARVELAQKRVLQARPLAQNSFALARELNDMPVLAECTCLLALIEWAEGRKEAPRRARLALTYAIQSGRRDVVDDVRARMKEILGDEL
jgi:tetratricopeptide (TPR) repeat protein